MESVHSRIGWAQWQQRTRLGNTEADELRERVRELEGELRRLSAELLTDALTGVANRRGLLRAYDAERARMQRSSQALAVCLLDIDDFKLLNDSLGHPSGDRALKVLTAHAAQVLRPMDTLARYGGEEFVVLMPHATPREACAALQRLQGRLAAEPIVRGHERHVITFSAGVTSARRDELLEQALERADRALYEAKRAGKNRVHIG